MAGDRRAAGGEYAARVNAAAELLECGVPVAEAARQLAARFGCWHRQARRYDERATAGGPVGAPQPATVLTVKLPVHMVERVRRRAAATGRTISLGLTNVRVM